MLSSIQEPVEPLNWEGILNTTENTKVCVQFESNDDRESEDCLYLNVYTPEVSIVNYLPSTVSGTSHLYYYTIALWDTISRAFEN